jgi:DNA-binding response OmpR family regulator
MLLEVPLNSPSHQKKTILIVDDDEVDRHIISLWLLAQNFEVYEAKDGEAALELAERISPKLIILDVNMPKMDGFVTCQRILQKQRHETSIIFLSNKKKDYDFLDGYVYGAVHYIAKPDKYGDDFFNIFKTVIDNALEKSEG